MRVLVGILFVFVLSLITAYALYFFLIRRKPKAKRRTKPKSKLTAKASAKPSLVKPQYRATSIQTKTPTRYRYELPPEIPRDINTMRIIAQEEPQIIIDIIRKWMRMK